MLQTTIIASIIAFLGGVAAYYSWNQNKVLSVISGGIGLIAAAVAILFAFLGALAIIFKIIPILILAGLVWLGWWLFSRRSSKAARDTVSHR